MARGMYVLCEIEGVLEKISSDKLPSNNHIDGELIFPTSRMLRGFARSGAEVVLISNRSEDQEVEIKCWLRDFGVDYDWLHLVPKGVSFETHIKQTLSEHKSDLLIAALVHDSLLRSVLAASHQRPTIYEVHK
ncbi:hypothetical protein HVX40_23930 (plasmid) [Escherichia coli]|nr:hypothetical protein [Escherichia coli]MBA8354058.1 hypothetical protein [Escherichia coli]